MSQSAKELLIIYEAEAEQWATYLQTVFTGPISESGIRCYDIASVPNQRDDFLNLCQYTCKLLILSKGMVEALSQKLRFFLARVLSPAAHVVVLLCGVESLTPLLELVPLSGNECLQISSDQDANEYLSAVTDIVTRAANVGGATRKSPGLVQMAEGEASSARAGVLVVPARVPCGVRRSSEQSKAEVFVLLKSKTAGSDAEVEFAGENNTRRVTPVRWNDHTLRVSAPDFPAGTVNVTVFSHGATLGTAQLQYYSSMEELTELLRGAAHPVDFMCQALQVSSMEKLDHSLTSMLLEAMPTGGFQGLQCQNRHERELRREDLPSLLHFAAQFGFRSVSSLLLQCPGAERALHTANRRGHTPAEIAQSHGHTELHVLLQEALNGFTSGDASVYETMCTAGSPSSTDAQKQHQGEEEEEEEEDLYTPLGVNDEHDTAVNSAPAMLIANRPPAPAPRPESTGAKEDKTPYIAQVFQKKKTPQGDTDLYSLPTKQARGREDGGPSTCDTFAPNQTHRLQQKGRTDSPTADGAGASQQETSSQPRARTINSREDGDAVYDKIHVVHQTPSAAANKGRRRNPPAESGIYSTPLKGQHPSSVRKPDKQ